MLWISLIYPSILVIFLHIFFWHILEFEVCCWFAAMCGHSSASCVICLLDMSRCLRFLLSSTRVRSHQAVVKSSNHQIVIKIETRFQLYIYSSLSRRRRRDTFDALGRARIVLSQLDQIRSDQGMCRRVYVLYGWKVSSSRPLKSSFNVALYLCIL